MADLGVTEGSCVGTGPLNDREGDVGETTEATDGTVVRSWQVTILVARR